MGKTRVLLIGSGAREHAIADALISSEAEIYSCMQLINPGIKKTASKFILVKADDTASTVRFAKENSVELAIIVPEVPLAAGVVDELEKNGVLCVGPTRKHAQLETSKKFTRELIKKYNIEGSPKFRSFTRSNIMEAKAFIEELSADTGCVVKPDGLTGGKGVKVQGEHFQSSGEALDYCSEILETHNSAVVEEKLEGEEFSLQTLTDGNGGFLHFPPVQDHKRAFEGDSGANTGGMGSYSDTNLLLPFLNENDILAARKITEKVAAAIKKELGSPYKGVMYGGFMKTAKGVRLLEYNARFGDPEATNVLPILRTSFLEICKAVTTGTLAKLDVKFEKKATVCKYVVPKGYPDKPEPGRIEVPSCEKDYIKALVYYAAVEEKADGIYTTKSRGVAFVGIADTITAAEKIAEEAAAMVKGQVYHRKDIGTHALVQRRVEHIKALTEGKRQLYAPKKEPMKVAALMSGSGTNLRQILELQEKLKEKTPFKVVMIFSDTADEKVSNAKKIADEYKVPLYCNDIKEYYARRGHNDRRDMKAREDYDSQTAALIRLHGADVVALCGYMSIVTTPIFGNFLTLNVHPADLRIKDSSGARKLSGCMGKECIKKAISEGQKTARSCTHIVNSKLDGGQILLVSGPVAVSFDLGASLQKLKEEGDWKIYPQTLRLLSEGRFSLDKGGLLYFDDKPIPEGREIE